jgi:predicted TIM-barrel fold metal-dependent hydrolase
MDNYGMDMQLLSLASPGVQVFERAQAVGLAESSNDRLAESVRQYPERFAGLAALRRRTRLPPPANSNVV